ncbi:FtsX-like permease family protein, partial [Thioclava electrotropha]|uniref:FtsX-like permease family protein n=1 Tax=Thioclava electrotropha TaxID=1549850 RepID=UPI0023A8B108
ATGDVARLPLAGVEYPVAGDTRARIDPQHDHAEFPGRSALQFGKNGIIEVRIGENILHVIEVYEVIDQGEHTAREIGILKAVGWNTRDVIAMKIWEGGLISLAAFLIGTVAGFAHVFFFGAPLFAPILQGWAVIYPDFPLSPHVDGLQLLTLALLTTLPYIAATVVPIWRTASADPDAVMR